ncbi:hypothetical protein PL11201_340009 [Planktothrix sp. PCC 11201]|nr:hypothetical protein PL11201_340009 [Planktothrix sp. PCC 11201]
MINKDLKEPARTGNQLTVSSWQLLVSSYWLLVSSVRVN